MGVRILAAFAMLTTSAWAQTEPAAAPVAAASTEAAVTTPPETPAATVPTDAMELLHCHIASEPQPLHERGVPRALSDIVAKLMAKVPEERYQSALGLKADLQECRRQLRERGSISPFKLGGQDASHQFEIPQKLYGREGELAAVLETFTTVSQGGTALLLVSGYSGIGKSSLIYEMHGRSLKRKGYFAAGKYDQYNRDVPYSALAKALKGLIHQFLKEPESQVAQWKDAIRQAVGQSGQVIMEVIPALALLLGEQPPVPSLPPAEALGRFNFVFADFLSVLATEQHPLILFLDDLQWADTPSLKLLEMLLTDSRRTLQEIGATVKLSPTTCWSRIKRLEADGVIKRYTVDVERTRLGYQDTVIVQLTLASHTDQTLYELGSI